MAPSAPLTILAALLLAAPLAAAQEPLTARAEANPPRATAPANVSFHAIPLGGTPPFAFAWDLGEGQTSAEQVAARAFATGGTYAARVTVTDANGAQALAEASVEVAPPLLLVAGSDFAGGRAPLELTLDAAAQGGTPPYEFTWDLGRNGGLVPGQVQRVHLAEACACVFSVHVRDAWGALAQQDVHVLTDPPSSPVMEALPFLALGLVLLAGIAGTRLARRR